MENVLTVSNGHGRRCLGGGPVAECSLLCLFLRMFFISIIKTEIKKSLLQKLIKNMLMNMIYNIGLKTHYYVQGKIYRRYLELQT